MADEKKGIPTEQLQQQVAEYTKQLTDYKVFADALKRVRIIRKAAWTGTFWHPCRGASALGRDTGGVAALNHRLLPGIPSGYVRDW
jgi:hypothetical protein